MAHFEGFSVISFLKDTETDKKSPGDEALIVTTRRLIENIYWWLGGVSKGTLTSDPPNDSTGYLYDSAAGFKEDEHNTRTVVFLDGDDVLNFYEITDTEAANNRIECSGQNFYAKGVRSGDAYMIICDLINNTKGHTHNNVDSLLAEMALGRQLAACHAGMIETASTSYVTVARFRIYVPTNASTLRAYFWLRSDAGGGYAYARFTLTDSDSTDFTSDEVNETGTSFVAKTVSDDCSAAAAGLGELKLELRNTTGVPNSEIEGVMFYWDT